VISIKQPTRLRRPDALRVSYIDPEKNYVTDFVMVGDAAGLVRNHKFMGCTSRQQASDLGVYNLERAQLDRVVAGTFRDDALRLEPHDIVTFTSSALNISGQTMRVGSTSINPDGTITLTLLYDSMSLYDDNYNLDAEDVYTCDLPDINAEPPSVGNVVLTEETYDYRLRTFTRLKCSFDEPALYPWLEHIQVWISFDDANWEHLFNVSDDFQIDPVEEGKLYYLRLKTVSIWGTKQTDEHSYKVSKTIIGETSAPVSLTELNAIANQNTVILYGDKVSDSDVELYEFRLGESWSGAIFLYAMRSPNLSLSGVKPGSHTFWCSTLSNNGIYGSVPRSASVTLIDPPDGWGLQTSQSDDYL
jgi:predicted phage tail protein